MWCKIKHLWYNSFTMMRKYTDPFDTQLASEDFENLCLKNKYFQVILVSYYKLTRNKSLMTAIKDLKDQETAKKISQEYVDFLGGKNVQVSVESEDVGFSLGGTFAIPANITQRDQASYLQELNKILQSGNQFHGFSE